MRDAGLQREIQTAVYRRSERFASETFVREFLGCVAGFLAARKGNAVARAGRMPM
jgi:hypothetical protein